MQTNHRESSKLTSPLLPSVSKIPKKDMGGCGGRDRQSLSISPNVKVMSDRKQLTDVYPAESVGVPGKNECRHILAYLRVAPFTPHYPAKDSSLPP